MNAVIQDWSLEFGSYGPQTSEQILIKFSTWVYFHHILEYFFPFYPITQYLRVPGVNQSS